MSVTELKKERNDAIVLACLQIYRRERERERELILCFGEFQLYRALAQKFALPRKCWAILLLIKHRGASARFGDYVCQFCPRGGGSTQITNKRIHQT